MPNPTSRWALLLVALLIAAAVFPVVTAASGSHVPPAQVSAGVRTAATPLPASTATPSTTVQPALLTTGSNALASRIGASPLPFVRSGSLPSALPATGSNPVTYSAASSAMTTAAAGVDGLSWGVSAVIADAAGSPSEFPLANITAFCTMAWHVTPVSQIYVPATPASAAAGTSNAYFALLANDTVPTEIVLADVINGTAQVVATTNESSACQLPFGQGILPSNVIDSPQAIALTNASGGAAFLTMFPGASKEWEISPGGVPLAWFVVYTAACGALYEAGISALSGAALGSYSSDQCAYNVTFTATGLPNGTYWSLDFNGSGYSSTGATITLNSPNGSFAYTVSAQGYAATPSSGTATISGSTFSQTVAFSLNASNYTVTFNGSGLAPGSLWFVSLVSNVTFNSQNALAGYNISFAVPNGTYLFTVQASGYNASPAFGTETVAGASEDVVVTFTALTEYAVTFSESGLPTGSAWSVQLTAAGPVFFGTSSNTTIVLDVPNGTYNWSSFTFVSGFVASPPNGSLVINGAGASTPVTYVQLSNYFAVVINETGLAAGATWMIQGLSSGIQVSNGTNLSVYLVNGSYSFSVVPLYGYTAAPTSGTVLVVGSTVYVNVVYTPSAMYLVTVNETGMASGNVWWVTVANVTTPVIGIAFAFYTASGTYPYTIQGPGPDWHAVPSSGNLTVTGSAVTLSVVFTFIATYPVTFTESGLPALTNWTVDLTSTPGNSSTTATVGFSLANGTYDFSVVDVAGYTSNPTSGTIVVSGSGVPLTVVFTPIPVGGSVVTFVAIGLPVTTAWLLNITNSSSNTTSYSASGVSLEVGLANGSYNATGRSSDTNYAGPGLLAFNVSGTNFTVNVTFTLYTLAVSFNETGLPAGAMWWANVTGGPSGGSTGEWINYTLPNGSYAYTFGSANKSYAAAAGGFSVTGSAVEVVVAFSQVTFAVTFTESGLPASTAWYVNITGGPSLSSTGTTQVAHLVNATWSYSVATSDKRWTATGSTVTVNGAAQSVTVTFTLVTFSVVFTESGLPAGTQWWANVTGQSAVSSTGTTATVPLANGSYTYTIGSADKSYAAVGGSVLVTGSALAPTVPFTLVTYTLTFTETGLPAGTNWSITIGSSTVSSTTATISFSEPNGTYTFTVGSVSGYSPNATTGSATINGNNPGRTVAFSSNPAASTFLGLPGNEGYYLLGGIVALLVILGALLGLRSSRRAKGKKDEPPASDTPPSGGQSPPAQGGNPK